MVYLACDHNGLKKMEFVKKWLDKNGLEYIWVGPNKYDATDSYADYIKKANAFVKKDDSFGIYMCGMGVGASIAANRSKGIRAVLCNDVKSAYYARFHNNANAIVFAGGYKSYKGPNKFKMAAMLKTFFSTKFEGERHIARIMQLDNIE